VADNGYQVDPEELNRFADYLGRTTSTEVSDAAKGVHSANGFDNAAFGIFAAQYLSIPARIDMALVTSNLNDLAKEITDAADRTKQAATNYAERDHQVANGLQTFKTELGK
jgi:hypothetical protein